MDFNANKISKAIIKLLLKIPVPRKASKLRINITGGGFQTIVQMNWAVIL